MNRFNANELLNFYAFSSCLSFYTFGAVSIITLSLQLFHEMEINI